jgi:phosphoribosylformylglycinamidine synthase
LVKLGLLPGYGCQVATLAGNDSGRFENRWVHHKTFKSSSIFTQGIDHLYLPVRHGEGKLLFKDADIHKKVVDNNQVVFRYATPEGNPSGMYPENPNGSHDAIAGMCDATGRILGMMAHPEAATRMIHHPRWTRYHEEAKRHNGDLPWYGDGLKLFQNAIKYLKER